MPLKIQEKNPFRSESKKLQIEKSHAGLNVIRNRNAAHKILRKTILSNSRKKPVIKINGRKTIGETRAHAILFGMLPFEILFFNALKTLLNAFIASGVLGKENKTTENPSQKNKIEKMLERAKNCIANNNR